jgi:uncharacterized repeat protein (TIGR02543 family)
VLVTSFALALVCAATARPLAKKPPATAATCSTLIVQKGGSGLLRITAAKGSLPIATTKLAPGTMAKTKTRTIKPAGKTAFRYTFAKKAGKAEKVRVVVTFSKANKTKTVVCAVKIGSPLSTLNVAFDGDGTGTITSTPAGISCTPDKSPCAGDFKTGAAVKLTAAPDTSSTFTGWTGACKGSATTCTVKPSGLSTVSAQFKKKTFTVTIQKAGAGNGTISSDGPLACGSTCTATLPAGTIVRLKAAPDASSTFTGWTGQCTSTVVQCNFPVDGDITVTATFDKLGNDLRVTPAGDRNGTITSDVPGIDCGSTCENTYPAGTVVTLTATPGAGELVQGWFGDCAGSTGNTCTLTMSSVKNAAVSFIKGATFSVSVVQDKPGAGGTVTSNAGGINCDEQGAAGAGNTCTSGLLFPTAVITLTATPKAGSSFVSWDNCPNALAGTGGAGMCQGYTSDFAGASPVAHFTSP